MDTINTSDSAEDSERRAALLKSIVDREQAMFVSVRSETPASCQSELPAFRIHRFSQLCSWSVPTLDSYQQDLQQAEDRQHNLMQRKYALMEQAADDRSISPLVKRIVALQVDWQNDLFQKYPEVASRGRKLDHDDGGSTSFRTYLQSELQTYSDATLSLLYADMQACRARSENWTELILLATIRHQRQADAGQIP